MQQQQSVKLFRVQGRNSWSDSFERSINYTEHAHTTVWNWTFPFGHETLQYNVITVKKGIL